MEIKPEVRAYLDDCELLGPINSGVDWFVTEDWVKVFKNHLEALLILAKKDDAISQYNVACIYSYGYLYANEQDSINNYETDRTYASYWFEKSARNGYIQAIDNLISMGVGEESERLRMIYNKHKTEFPLTSPPSSEWLNNLQKLHTMAYKNI